MSSLNHILIMEPKTQGTTWKPPKGCTYVSKMIIFKGNHKETASQFEIELIFCAVSKISTFKKEKQTNKQTKTKTKTKTKQNKTKKTRSS